MNVVEYLKSTREIVGIAFVLRIIFSPFTGHPYDLGIWMESGELIASGVSPYSPTDHLGQTILWALWTGFSYLIASTIPFGSPWVYIFLIKLLPIVADFVAVYLILEILQEELGEFTPHKLRKYTVLFIFNPVLIFASAFWAMADSMALVCILMAYKNLNSSKLWLTSIWMSVSIALKLYPVILVPVFLLYLIMYNDRFDQAVVLGTLIVFQFLIIAYLPFLFLPWDANEISGVLTSQTARTFGGMSILGLLTVGIESSFLGTYVDSTQSELVEILWIRFFWLTNSILLSLLILVLYYKRDLRPPEDKFVGFYGLIIIYYIMWILTATWVSEQNFVPLLLICTMYLIYLREKGKDTNYIYTFLVFQISFVTAHIILNVPIILFFHLLNPNFGAIYNDALFTEVRALVLFLLIFLSSINLILMMKFHGRSFTKELHHLNGEDE